MPAPNEDLPPRSLLRRIGVTIFACLVAFGPAAFVHAPLLRGDLPHFRDTRHFYQPALQRQALSWSEGRVPLWNDSEGMGFPEFAEPTAAVFYPGKIVFALPIPWGVRWFLYFVTHAGIACFGARRFARSCGLSPYAGLFAGAAYAASGELLFQSCNPVYLVGAAWLPWALASAIDLRRTLKAKHAAFLAIAASLALLGGDPQTVYHVGLLIVLALAGEIAVAGLRFLRNRFRRTTVDFAASNATEPFAAWRSRAKFAALLLFAGALTLGLSAVQILPAVDWLRESERAASIGDGTVADVAERYDFSVGPWRWADFLVPQAFGSPFPIHRRWSYAFFPEGRIWTPSYYLGLAPFLLLPAAILVSTTRRRLLLPVGLALAALAFALGEYGVGWFAKEIASRADTKLDVENALGGPYWLLVQAAPFYDLFRYPAKWMPAATLGLAVAGAAGIDAMRYSIGRKATCIAAGLVATALAGSLATTWLLPFHDLWFAIRIGAESTFGPWDAEGALVDLRWSLGHSIAVAACVFLVVSLATRSSGNLRSSAAGTVALIAIAAIDPAVANRNLVPAGRYSIDPASTIDWGSLGIETSGPLAMRYFRGNVDHLPSATWKDSSSPERLHELAEWERASYRPRLGPADVPALRSSGSLEPADLAPFLSAWRDSHLTGRDPDAEGTIAELEERSVGLLILPPDVRPVRGEFVQEISIPPTDSKVALWRLPGARPRWSWSDDPALVERAKAALNQGAELQLTPSQREALSPVAPMHEGRGGEGVEVKLDSPHNPESRFPWHPVADLAVWYSAPRPAVLIWNDRFDPGWIGTDIHRGVTVPFGDRPIGRADPGVRFVVIEGDGGIRFDYRSASLRYGAVITIAALAGLIVVPLCRVAYRRLRRRLDRASVFGPH